MKQKTGWIFLTAGLVVLAALFMLFKPDAPPAGPASATAAEEQGAQHTAPGVGNTPSGPHLFELVVKQGRLVSGPAVIQVKQGDEVRLVFLVDQADEIHLHGYDLSLSLLPGAPAELSFTADRAGRFEYELHKSHADLGVLEVHPR